MKYMQTGSYRAHVLMRLTLGCTVILLAAFWCTNWLLYFRTMDLAPASVVDYFRGSEAEFRMPRTYGAMLEVTHMHLPMMAMVLLLLTHLAIFLPWSLRLRVLLVLGSFGCALGSEGAGWLVRFVHPGFAWVKIVTFLGLQAGLAVLLVGLATQLLQRPARTGAARALHGPAGPGPERCAHEHAAQR